MEFKDDSSFDEDSAESPEPPKPQKKGDGEKKSGGASLRGAAILSAPTILIVYPLVGFGIGYLTVRLWHWPDWVPIVTLLMGLIQGMRDVYRLGLKIEKDDRK